VRSSSPSSRAANSIVSSARPIALALSLVLCSTLLRLALDTIDPEAPPFATYFPAVVLAGLFWGRAPAVAAIAGSVIVSWWALFPPGWTMFIVPDTKSLVALILFLVSGGVIVCITAAYHRALRNLHAEQEKRELLVNELVHRSRNTFAVASLIVNRTLRDQADIARAINGRLKALLSTNETLIFSDSQSCSLLQLLRNELEPYPVERVALAGPDVQFHQDLARSLALIFHELVTNSAKYGALASTAGVLDIDWNVKGERVTITWQETCGRTIEPPSKKGFGTTLIHKLIQHSGGAVESKFHPTGLAYTMYFDKNHGSQSAKTVEALATSRRELNAGAPDAQLSGAR